MPGGKEHVWMAMARYLAGKSLARNKHGAVIVRGGRLLGAGANKDRNNPLICSPEHIKTRCSVHAETAALKEAGERAWGATLYVARVNNAGTDRDSRPCAACAKAISEAGVRKVVYTTSTYGMVHVRARELVELVARPRKGARHAA